MASNTYDAEGRMVKAVDEEGAVTLYAYDNCGRLTSMTDALGHVTTFEYDVMDRVTKVTDAKGNGTTYTYDALGNVVTQTNAKGVTTTYTYDANSNLTSVKDAAGTTAYTLDALGRVTAVTDRKGNAQSFTYDAGGRITKVTDKNGNETAYTYDGNGNIVKTTDALGNESVFAYNANDQLVSMDLHRVDGVNGADEHQVTLYEYDGRNLVTKEINAAGGNTLYVYDGNGNMVSKTDAGGYVTEYTYSPLDLVSHISYNGAKEVTYQYNKVGELVKMDDWLGTTTFELDLLNQLKKVTDHKGNVVEYTYDKVGNQLSLTYPDKSTVSNSYDTLGQLTQMTDGEGGKYTYTYDNAGNVTKLTYPNGWVEEYSYDAEGNLLKTVDTDPFHNNKKSTKYQYTYDAEGNLITEYQRDSDGEAGLVANTTYTYDALNRLTGSQKTVEKTRKTYAKTYTYDSLGNLVQENGPTDKDQTTYQYNSLNQMVARKECGYVQSITRIHDYGYTYDGRGNLIKEEEICSPTTQGPKNITIAAYTYDETNKMVSGTNKDGEVSNYTLNGLGVRVGTEVIVKDNTHGYTDFHCQTPTVETGIDKPEVVLSDYVIDYTRLNIDQRVLVESETDGYDFRYTYGLDLVNVNVTGDGTDWWAQSVKKCVYSDYVHTDRLGSVVNLTDQYGRVPAQVDYDDWGKVTAYQSLDISGGYRTVLPEITYAGHQYDDVLGMYYAKARMYDAENRRFASADPVKGRITEPMTMVQYLYVVDNPLGWVDPLGLVIVAPSDGSGSSTVDLYINGQLYQDIAKRYENQTWIKVPYIKTVERAAGIKSGKVGFEPEYDAITGAAPVATSQTVNSIPKTGYYQQGTSKKIYFQTFGCDSYVRLDSFAEVNGLQDTLSWWAENGIMVVTFNSIMKDAPIKVVRNGREITISIYASFSGDYNRRFDNYDAAKALYGDNINKSDYQSDYTYAELIALGVTENWGQLNQAQGKDGLYYPQYGNGIKYDDFGSYSSVHVTVNFYGKQPSPNGVYSPAPNVSNTQEYVYINVASEMPASKTDKTGKKTIDGSAGTAEESYQNWSIDKAYHMNICDYKGTRNASNKSEKSVAEFMQTAAHEMGHAMGLGDAYKTTWHDAASVNSEMLGEEDMMWGNGQVSSNNIEMLLEAFKTNSWQEFVDSANLKKSPVIRLP